MIGFKLAAIVPSSESQTKFATIYLFNKQGALILPIEVTKQDEKLIASVLNENTENNDIYSITNNITKLLKGTLECLILDSLTSNSHMAFVRVSDYKKIVFDFDIHIAQGFLLAIKTQIPILVSDKIVKKYAIKITKQMLDKVI